MHRFPVLPVTSFLLAMVCWSAAAAAPPARTGDALWDLARREASVHRFSTLFTAHDVRNHLSSEEGLRRALDWCKRTAVTKVYIESFRDGYRAEPDVLDKARDRFRTEGFEVSGCVTPTAVGKRSNRWNIIACYTDRATQDALQAIFEIAARHFDEVMIDDFWFTDCTCPDCEAARRSRRVTVGDRVTTAASDTWEDYRRELMTRLSVERVIGPAKEVNPRCKLIIKYPQWYDVFHERGYDVDRETRIFDRIWVGTETRDYDDKQWGGTVQYEAFFIMRWLGGLGGEKCGGGWYDWLGTTEQTYIEQARQTILGGARESLLFCYGGLQGTTGPANVAALRREIPGLLETAGNVAHRSLRGVAAYKPANSAPGLEKRVFDFVGMLGIPLVPCHEFPSNAPAAFFSRHALKDPGFPSKLRAFLDTGRPVLMTDGLAATLPATLWKDHPSVVVLPLKGEPKSLLELGESDAGRIRAPLLAALGITLRAPNRVSLCLFDDGSVVVQNFNNQPVTVDLDGRKETLPARDWMARWNRSADRPRSPGAQAK